MFKLKPLSKDAVRAATEKAMRYRLLNEPAEAESICLDILEIEPENQEVLVILLLAMTDRFGKGYGVGDAQLKQVLSRLHGEYDRAYYAGIICERRAKACLTKDAPGAKSNAYDHLCKAMFWYEKAEGLRPPGNDDAVLRWNTCARLIQSNDLRARIEEPIEHGLE